MFSTLGTIKVDKHSCLTNESRDDLLLLKSNNTPLASFNADPSIDLWWSAKARRPAQTQRNQYRPRSSCHPGPLISLKSPVKTVKLRISLSVGMSDSGNDNDTD